MCCREHLDAPKWTKHLWMDSLQKGSDKKRFQYCLDSDAYFLFMRAVHGHSGGNKVDLSLQDNVGIPYKYSFFL